MAQETPPFKLVPFAAGAYIVLEGEKKANSFYIIREGKVNLKRDYAAVGERSSQVLGPGDFFGVVAAMSQYPQIESAIAMSKCLLISVAYNRFGVLIQKNPVLAMKIIRYFSKRLREMNLSSRSDGGAESSITDSNSLAVLFDMAENYFNLGNIESAIYLYQSYIKYLPAGEYTAKCKEKLEMLNAPVEIKNESQETHRNYPSNQMIFCENEPGNDMYIIQKGKIKITKMIEGRDITLGILKQGDIFGEMSLIDNKPRSASAITTEQVALLAINKKNFEGMVKTQPQLMTRIIVILSERVWDSYRKLANTMIKDVNGRIADMLLTLVEKSRVKVAPRANYDFQLNVVEFLKMMGLSDRDLGLFQKFTKANGFVRIDRGNIICSDLALLERLVYTYREER
ncbi:MAG: cyclic nucleotide-binding domain-containing protein [Spirochaetota bacterium]